MKTEKYLTKSLLREINDAAKREKRNRWIDRDFIEQLPNDAKFPIVDYFYHNKNEFRLMIVLNDEPAVGYIDVSALRFEIIPTASFHDDGSVVIEEPSAHDAKRPYPNGREWKETVTMAPVRDQARFRREVLNAYAYQCAICDVRDKSLLRAAHIVDVALGGPDTMENGICLCTNHEISFDNGLILINDRLEVINRTTGDLGIKYSKLRDTISSDMRPNPVFLREKLSRFTDRA